MAYICFYNDNQMLTYQKRLRSLQDILTYEKRLRSLHNILVADEGVLKNANCLKKTFSEKYVPSLILKLFNSILQILLTHQNMTDNSKIR